MAHDQYSRWLCPKCGRAGIDSWNKAMHDGIDHGGEYPNPWILGLDCEHCIHPVTVAWYGPDDVPRAIFGETVSDWQYEPGAMQSLETDPLAGVPLEPSTERDRDWSHGCAALREAPPLS